MRADEFDTLELIVVYLKEMDNNLSITSDDLTYFKAKIAWHKAWGKNITKFDNLYRLLEEKYDLNK